MKHFVLEYVDNKPLRVFLIKLDEETDDDKRLLEFFGRICRNRMENFTYPQRTEQVNYYRHPQIQDFNNSQMTQLILAALETSRVALSEPGKPTIPSVSFTDVVSFFRYIGWDVHTEKFSPTSVAGMIDARMERT